MNKWLLTLTLPLVLIGCSPEDGGSTDSDGNGGDGSGDGDNTSSGATVTDSNAQAMVERTLPNFDLSKTVNDPFGDFTDMLITSPDDRQGATRTNLNSRIQDSIACDTGTATVTYSGHDVGSGTPPADGSSAFEANYSDCVISESGQNYQVFMHMDGKISADLSWTGYDSGADTFTSYSINLAMEQFYLEIDINGQSTVMESDYSMSYSLSGSTLAYEYEGSVGFGDLSNGTLSVKTTTPITVDTSMVPARPQSGEVIMTGANATSITFTVVANGVEVSVNGGQAQLYTWSEVESN